MRLAIVSQSARIYAEMARREGFDVLAIDAFVDTDTIQAANDIWQLPALCGQLKSEDITSLLNKLDLWQPDYVLVGSGFEAEISSYEKLYQRYSVLGNLPTVIQQVKNPEWLTACCLSCGVQTPEIRLKAPEDGKWLHKQAGQSGGAHIQEWSSDISTTANGYWQAFQSGQAVGALFVATEQAVALIGVHALKQRPGTFTYAGASKLQDPQLLDAMNDLLRVLVPSLDLVGINSVDAIWQDGQLHVLEINPRLSASMRLYTELPLIEAHISSCQNVELPVLHSDKTHVSHCILYARHAINVKQLSFPDWVEDRPGHGKITAGQPICSIYAQGNSDSEVQQILQDKKTQLEKIWGPYVCEHIEFNIH